MLKVIIRISIIVCIVAGFVSCEQSKSDLKETLFSVVAKKHGSEDSVMVSLNELTDFQWQRMFIFAPYTPIQKIHKSLGFEWDRAEKTNIHMRDDICLLVFVSNNRVVQYFEYPRNHGDFSEIHVERGFAPSEALFEVVEAERGESWLVFTVIKDK